MYHHSITYSYLHVTAKNKSASITVKNGVFQQHLLVRGAVGDVNVGLPPGYLNTPLKVFPYTLHGVYIYGAISTPKGRYVFPQAGVIVTTLHLTLWCL